MGRSYLWRIALCLLGAEHVIGTVINEPSETFASLILFDTSFAGSKTRETKCMEADNLVSKKALKLNVLVTHYYCQSKVSLRNLEASNSTCLLIS